MLLAFYAGLSLLVIASIAIQFLYRYYCLLDSRKTEYFDGWKSLIWILYPVSLSSSFSVFMMLCLPDEYTDEYARLAILQNYNLVISETPRFAIILVEEDSSIRWKNSMFMIICFIFHFFHFAVIIFLGNRMNSKMKSALQHFSVANQELQRQFFSALIAQTLGPTMFLFLPIASMMIWPFTIPFFGIEIDWKSGFLHSFIGLYPSFDGIVFMIIVSEYRKLIEKKFRGVFSINPPSVGITTQETPPIS